MEGRIPARPPSGAAPEPYSGSVGVWRRLLRRHLVSLVSLAVAGLICVAAVADHRDKQSRIDRAEVAEWYCTHLGTRCGGPSSESIERHWNERQLGYEIAASVFGAFAIAIGVYRTARS